MNPTTRDVQAYLAGAFPSVKVYIQPPENIKIQYPCLIVSLDKIQNDHADNKPFYSTKVYSLMYISKTFDELIIDKLLSLESSRYVRMFITESLYHFIATIHSLALD